MCLYAPVMVSMFVSLCCVIFVHRSTRGRPQSEARRVYVCVCGCVCVWLCVAVCVWLYVYVAVRARAHVACSRGDVLWLPCATLLLQIPSPSVVSCRVIVFMVPCGLDPPVASGCDIATSPVVG